MSRRTDRAHRLTGVTGAALLTAALLAGCSNASGDHVLTVSVPSSLRAVMTTIAADFQSAHPGMRVVIAGPDAPGADVIATDDEASMTRLGAAVVSPRRFASDSLIIVTAPGNPKHLTGFGALGTADVRVAACGPRLACGTPVVRVEQLTGVPLPDLVAVDSGEAAVALVTSGRVDAALTYRTQARPGSGMVTVDDPVFAKAVNRYPIGVARASRNDGSAAEFVKTVIGPVGGRALATAGFGPPSG